MDSVEHEILHKDADSLLDYIKLIFHEDVGEGHLEHVVVSDIDHLNIDTSHDHNVCVFPNEIFTELLAQTSKKTNFTYQLGNKQSARRSTYTLRGPPQNS